MAKNYLPYADLPGITQLLPDLPVPFPIPLIGHNNYVFCAVTLTKKFQQYFPNAKFIRCTTGTTTNLFVRGPEVFKEVMIKQAEAFPKPPEVYSVLNLYGPNIVTTNDSVWKLHRRVCEPAFSEEHMKYLALESSKSTELMFKRFGEGVVTINADKEMTDVTLEIIGRVVFGTNLGVYENVPIDTSKHTITMRNALENTLGLGLLVRGVLPQWMNFLFPGTCKAVDEAGLYIRELIERKKTSTEERFDLLSLIATANDTSLDLSTNEMIADSFVFLFAGFETSATNLQWILYELSQHPEIQEKIFQEVSTVLNGKEPTYAEYESLKYTNCVISECLRLHPPVTFLPKVAKRDTVVCGQKIKQGTMVFLDIVSVHRNEEYWENPLEFKPERFDTTISPRIVPYAYAPFSIGSRKCIGFFFSLLETCVILSKIVQKYEIRAPAGVNYSKNPIEEYQQVTIKPRDLHVELVPRK
jgi:cytochrome P450